MLHEVEVPPAMKEHAQKLRDRLLELSKEYDPKSLTSYGLLNVSAATGEMVLSKHHLPIILMALELLYVEFAPENEGE